MRSCKIITTTTLPFPGWHLIACQLGNDRYRHSKTNFLPAPKYV